MTNSHKCKIECDKNNGVNFVSVCVPMHTTTHDFLSKAAIIKNTSVNGYLLDSAWLRARDEADTKKP